MGEAADVIGSKGLVKIDGERIAAIILAETHCPPRLADAAAKGIIRYLIAAIAKAEAERKP